MTEDAARWRHGARRVESGRGHRLRVLTAILDIPGRAILPALLPASSNKAFPVLSAEEGDDPAVCFPL
jgi:hypothetical protein